jgi:hypothetical protein
VGGDLNVDSITDKYFSHVENLEILLFVKRLNVGLSSFNRPKINGTEIYGVLEAWSLAHFYGVPFANLYPDPNTPPDSTTPHPYIVPSIKLPRLKEIWDSLRVDGENRSGSTTWHEGHDLLPSNFTEALRTFSQSSSALAWTIKAILTLDDDKLRHRSKMISTLGAIRVYHRDGEPGPTVHMLAHTVIGCILSAHMQLIHDTTASCAKENFKLLRSKQHMEDVELEGSCVSVDRAYNSPTFSDMVAARGGIYYW